MAPTTKTQDLNFKVDPERHWRFKMAAHLRPISMNKLLEEAFEAWLEKNPRLADKLRALEKERAREHNVGIEEGEDAAPSAAPKPNNCPVAYPPRPVEGDVDLEALIEEVVRRFPNVLKRLKESPGGNPS